MIDFNKWLKKQSPNSLVDVARKSLTFFIFLGSIANNSKRYLLNVGTVFIEDNLFNIKKMLGSIAPRFKNAWRVTNIETQEKFDNYRKEIG